MKEILKKFVLERRLFLTEIENDKEFINLRLENKSQKNVGFLAIIIILELVLGGSGRLITFGSFLSLRYILFFIAFVYFILKCRINNFKIKKNLFYIDIIVFFFAFTFAIANGILSGYEIGDIIKSSKGYLYLLIYFPISLLIDNKEKSKQIFKLFLNSSVVLAIVALTIFVFFYFDHTKYHLFTPILNKLDYGYIALRGGLPAVFLKTSPMIAIAFVLLLVHYINLKTERNFKNIIKLSILLFGIVSTMSMGLWVATFVGVMLTIVLSKGKYKVVGLATVILLMSFAYYFLSEYINVSITNRLNSNDSSFIIKFDQFFRLIENWSNRLIFGNGFGIEITFLTDLGSRTMINFELFWLQLLVNMGLVGFIIYIKMFIKSIFYSIKTINAISFEESLHIKSLIVGLVVLAIISSVNPFLNNPIGIGYLVIVMNTISTYSKDLKKGALN
jgi:hypothetical protein